jgi:hypothetical protein
VVESRAQTTCPRFHPLRCSSGWCRLCPATGQHWPPAIPAESDPLNLNIGIFPPPTSAPDIGVDLGVCGPIPANGATAGLCSGETHDVTKMTFGVDDKYPSQVNEVTITAFFNNLEPQFCPSDASYNYPACKFQARVPLRHHFLSYMWTLTLPDGIFYSKAGSYATAAIPGIQVDAANATIYQNLELQNQIPTSQVSVLEGPSPTSSLASSWQWKMTGYAAQQVAFTLTDISGIQNDSKSAFISGIFFGVAGGALIALIEQLLRPLGPSDTDDPVPEASD